MMTSEMIRTHIRGEPVVTNQIPPTMATDAANSTIRKPV